MEKSLFDNYDLTNQIKFTKGRLFKVQSLGWGGPLGGLLSGLLGALLGGGLLDTFGGSFLGSLLGLSLSGSSLGYRKD